MTPLERFICHHPERTPCDAEGYAICTRCGGTIVMQLTPAVLDRFIEEVKNRGRRFS